MPGHGALPPPGQKRWYIGLTMYQPLHLRARERNQTVAYRRAQKGHRIGSEGTLASLDRPGWDRSRLRGLWRVDGEGYMAALAHNAFKAVRRLRQGTGPTAPLKPQGSDSRRPGNPNRLWGTDHPWRAYTLQVY